MDGMVMRKLYKKDGEIYEFAQDGSQDSLIAEDFVAMTESEIDQHINPQKYMSDEEKLQLVRQQMPQLTPIEFDIKLNNAGLYDAVQDLIKDNFEMRIAYNRATFFSRTASFVDQARIALGLTDEQVDAMWTS